MRSFLPTALAGVASFACGLAAALWVQRDPTQAEVAPPAESRSTRESAAQNADNSQAASATRIDALFSLAKETGGLAEDHAVYAALQNLQANDFLAAAKDLSARISSLRGSRVQFAEAWFERWLEVDTPGALRFLGTSPLLEELGTNYRRHPLDDRISSSPQAGAVRALARRQPEWLEQYLSALEENPQRELGLHTLLDQSARRDIAKAKQSLARFPNGASRRASLGGFVAGVSVADPRAGFDAALAETAGPFREGLLAAAIGGAGTRGVAVVRELLDRIDDRALRARLATKALSTLGSTARDDLLPWIMEESERFRNASGSDYEFRLWATDVAMNLQVPQSSAAADWAETLGQDPEKLMLASISGRWARQEPAGLRDWLKHRAATLDPTTVEKLGKTLGDLVQRQPSATREWAESLPPGRLREAVQLQLALGAGAEGDLMQAQAMYERIAPSDASGELAKQVAEVLAAQSGPVAAQWATQRPPGVARDAAIPIVAEQWAQRNPLAAGEWLRALPAGPERDRAVRGYVAKAVYADPAAAAEWVEQVADPTIRAEAAARVFWTWMWEDPVTPRAWVRSLPGVTEKWRTDFLRKVK